MKKISRGVFALLFVGAVGLAHARAPLSDQDLAQVRGEDGTTVMGDLNIHTEAFVYTDTDATGGLISFNNVSIQGMYVKRYDILRGLPASSTMLAESNTPGTFGAAVAQSMQRYLGEAGTVLATSQTAQQMNVAMASGVYPGGDVVQIAFPSVGLSGSVAPSYSVNSITMGNSSASFGSLSLDRVDLQGTKRWLWPH